MGDLIELIGDGSRETPPKLGLATAVMENATDYGSTQCSILQPEKLGVPFCIWALREDPILK
jgi:hypothetical protein